MSVMSRKITIYSSPQIPTTGCLSKQTDINQNSKLCQNNADYVSAPQRTTIRLRIKDPKELEMLKMAASQGNATVGGRKVRIVSVQPSHVAPALDSENSSSWRQEVTSSVSTSNYTNVPNMTSHLASGTQESSSSFRETSGSCVPHTTNGYCSQLNTGSMTTTFKSLSLPSVTNSVFSPHMDSCALEMPFSAAESQNDASTASATFDSHIAGFIGRNGVCSASSTACSDRSCSTSFVQTAGYSTGSQAAVCASAADCSSNVSYMTSDTGLVREAKAASACLTDVSSTCVSSGVAAPLKTGDAESAGLKAIGSPLPANNYSSITVRTMVSQGAKYLGSFAFNPSASDNTKLDLAGARPVPANVPVQKYVLKISSKGNSVNINSLTSAERLPALLKAINRVLSEKSGNPVTLPSLSSTVLEQGQQQLSRASTTVTSKPANVMDVQKTVYGTVKRQSMPSKVGRPAKRAAYNCSSDMHMLDSEMSVPVLCADGCASDKNRSCSKILKQKNINSREYIVNNSLSMGSYVENSNSLKRLGESRDVHCQMLDDASGFISNGRVVYFDGCQSVRIHDEPVRDGLCARLRPFVTRKKRGMFSFLMSKHRRKPISAVRSKNNSESSLLCSDLPAGMRFRHLHQYVNRTVFVFRSPIHGLGLFARRHIVENEMLVEYAGEVIRSSVADVRERRYDAAGIGCYMFRHGDDDVVDATRCGNLARFINHSCEPNCFSREIVVDGRRHIIIIAKRSIRRGDELTYDYKFPIEDVKMPCTCNAPRCRKYLN